MHECACRHECARSTGCMGRSGCRRTVCLEGSTCVRCSTRRTWSKGGIHVNVMGIGADLRPRMGELMTAVNADVTFQIVPASSGTNVLSFEFACSHLSEAFAVIGIAQNVNRTPFLYVLHVWRELERDCPSSRGCLAVSPKRLLAAPHGLTFDCGNERQGDAGSNHSDAAGA